MVLNLLICQYLLSPCFQNKAPSVNQSQPRVRQKNFSRQSADQPRPLVVQDPGPSCSFQLYEPTCSYQTAGMQSRPSAGLYEPSWSYQTAGMQSRPRAKPEVPPSCSYKTAGMQSRPLAKPEVPSSCSYQTVGMQSWPRAKLEVPSCSYQTAGMQSRPCAEPEVPPSSFQTAGLLSRPLAEPEVPPSAPPDSKANIFSSSLPRVREDAHKKFFLAVEPLRSPPSLVIFFTIFLSLGNE